jgi:hypothetical protein
MHLAECFVDANDILATELDDLVDAQLPDHIDDLIRLRNQVDAKLLDAAGAWDDRQLWAADGAANGRQGLAGHYLSRQEAASLINSARRLRRTNLVHEAVRDGRLSVSQGRILARLRNERVAEDFDRDEELLVKEAEALTVDQTDRLARFWKANADSDGAEPDYDRDRLHLSPLPDEWKVGGYFSSENGALLNSVLNQIMDEIYHAEEADGLPHSTAEERRAAALLEMARRATAADDHKPSARPLLIIKADLEALEAKAGRAAITDDGTVITGEALRRLACDARISRVITDGPSEILDVGRESRTATAAQRRALLVRDGGCVFPGCDRPPGWCEAHHIRWWDDGGTTDLDNLCLLCSYHHHQIHKGNFNATRNPDGTITFTRRDGTIVGPRILAGVF